MREGVGTSWENSFDEGRRRFSCSPFISEPYILILPSFNFASSRVDFVVIIKVSIGALVLCTPEQKFPSCGSTAQGARCDNLGCDSCRGRYPSARNSSAATQSFTDETNYNSHEGVTSPQTNTTLPGLFVFFVITGLFFQNFCPSH